MEHPVATTRTRQRYKYQWLPNASGGEMVQRRYTTGQVETVREATCPAHGRKSPHFTGPNEAGWVFWCPGALKGEMEDPDEGDNMPLGHYFLALPA